jgi:hypothetical protein
VQPEVVAIAEAQAAKDRELLARLLKRDGPLPVRTPVAGPVRAVNLAIRPKKRRK